MLGVGCSDGFHCKLAMCNYNSKPAWVQKISQLSVFQRVQKKSEGNYWTPRKWTIPLTNHDWGSAARSDFFWNLCWGWFIMSITQNYPIIIHMFLLYQSIHILLFTSYYIPWSLSLPHYINYRVYSRYVLLSPSSWLPSGNLTVRYWTWPSRNSGWIPIENGDVP